METWRQELYLSHHGIKGQRWGVKNGPPYPLEYRNLSRPEKKSITSQAESESERNKKVARNIAIGMAATAVAIGAIGGMYVYKKSHKPLHITEYNWGYKINLSELSDKVTILKSGSALQRISSRNLEDYAKDGKRLYVAYKSKDKRLYKEEMPDYIKKWAANGIIKDSDGSAYVHQLKTKRPIKVASDRVMAETYMEVMGVDEIDAGKYKQFFTDMTGENNRETLEFFNAIRKKGYNAITDKNDEGWAQSPLILLNPSQDIASDKSHKLGKIERFVNVLLM